MNETCKPSEPDAKVGSLGGILHIGGALVSITAKFGLRRTVGWSKPCGVGRTTRMELGGITTVGFSVCIKLSTSR